MKIHTSAVIRRAAAVALSAAWLAAGSPALAIGVLLPVNVSANADAARLTISGPLRPSGRMSELSLRADARPGGLASVRFELFYRAGNSFGDAIYERNDASAPFCLFDGSGANCGLRKIGELLPSTPSKAVPGAYRARISSLDASGNVLWRGDVHFVLAASGVSLGLPPNGTNDGVGIFVEWRDPVYSPSGISKLNMEIRASMVEGADNGTGIGYVLFTLSKIGPGPDDKTEVFRRHELNRPYCLFGEEADGKTCRSVRRGERFPASSILNNDGDPGAGKRDDPALARVKLEPGEYEIAIQVFPKDPTAGGFWGGNGRFVVVGG